jgi:hypothetical protein
MGLLVVQACRHVEHTIAAPSQVYLPVLERADDELDRLHRLVLDAVAHTEPPYPVRRPS